MDYLIFEESKSFDEQVSSFLSILDGICSLYQQIKETVNVTKMIRSLSPYFDAQDMATSVKTLSFDELISVVQANIERRMNKSSVSGQQNRVQFFLTAGSGTF